MRVTGCTCGKGTTDTINGHDRSCTGAAAAMVRVELAKIMAGANLKALFHTYLTWQWAQTGNSAVADGETFLDWIADELEIKR